MSLEDFKRQMRENIDKYGRTILTIPNGMNTFTYTVGNSLKDLPELLLIGPFANTIGIMNVLSERMIERGRPFDEHQLIDFGGRFPLTVFTAAETVKVEYTLHAGHFADGPYSVMQIVFCDEAGLFPWEPGCAKPYADIPVFYADPALRKLS